MAEQLTVEKPTLEILKDGREMAKFSYPQLGLNIRFDTRYKHYEKYLPRVLSIISRSPFYCPQNVSDISFSYRIPKSKKAACAFPTLKKMNFYRGHLQQQRPYFTHTIFDHEMAHLIGNKMGGPPSVTAWDQARSNDKEYIQALPSALYQSLILPHVGIGRKLVEDPQWITNYARRKSIKWDSIEDWAESMAYWAYDRRHGRLYMFDNHKIRFADIFPARHEFIISYMKKRPVNPLVKAAPITSRQRIRNHLLSYPANLCRQRLHKSPLI